MSDTGIIEYVDGYLFNLIANANLAGVLWLDNGAERPTPI
jgi:hypothetical protein